jgi:hypothetical protein
METGTPYWMVSAETPEYPLLTEDISVDVAVVGAGIAGLSIAAEPKPPMEMRRRNSEFGCFRVMRNVFSSTAS